MGSRPTKPGHYWYHNTHQGDSIVTFDDNGIGDIRTGHEYYDGTANSIGEYLTPKEFEDWHLFGEWGDEVKRTPAPAKEYRKPVGVADSGGTITEVVCDDGSVWGYLPEGYKWLEKAPIPGSKRTETSEND